MPETRFEALRLELLQSGVAPIYVRRTIDELDAHCADLEAAALAAGRTPAEAAQLARESLGSEQAIVAAVLARPALLAWNQRWPRTAHCLQSAAALGVLPGLPLAFCLEHRPELARWGVAFGAATLVVSGVLTTLDWLLVVG